MEASNELAQIPIEIRIPEQIIDNYLNGYRNLSISTALAHLVEDPNLVVDVVTTNKTTREYQAKSPIINMAHKSVLDGNRKVFSGETDDQSFKLLADRDYYMGVGLLIEALLKRVFRALIEEKGLLPQHLITFFRKWPFWDDTNTPIIQVGIERFFQGDFVSALHVLVPQLERYVRQAFAKAGHATTAIKGVLQQEQIFGEFLKKDYVKDALPPNFLKYLEIVMVEQTGFNLRNNVAHGLVTPEECNENHVLAIIHLFLLLTKSFSGEK